METVLSPTRSRTNWGAIFAGAFVAVGAQILLLVLGLAIGLTAIDANAQNPFSGLGIGSLIWLLITAVLSLFAGAYVTGRLSTAATKTDGVLNGAVVWALFLVFSVFVTGSGISGIAGGLGSIAQSGASAADSGVVEDVLERSGLTQEPESPQAQQAKEQMRQEDAQQQGEPGLSQQDAVDVIAKNTGLSREQAQNLLLRAREGVGQIDEQDARGFGAAVTQYSSVAFWGLFALLAVMLVSAMIGGSLGAGLKRGETVRV